MPKDKITKFDLFMLIPKRIINKGKEKTSRKEKNIVDFVCMQICLRHNLTILVEEQIGTSILVSKAQWLHLRFMK